MAKSRRASAGVHKGELTLLSGVLLAVVLLWNTPIVYPLKILVVFFHELSHAVMTLATGGRVHAIQLSVWEGGLTLSSGGSPFLIAGAGYLGSLVCGGLVLLSAQRTKWYGRATLAIGIVVLLVALAWVRPLFSFGMLFCLLSAAALLWLGRRGSPALNHFVLVLIGLTSCLYALLDIKADILDQPLAHSDARALAAMSGIPTLVWGIFWLALGLAAAWWFLRESTRVGR